MSSSKEFSESNTEEYLSDDSECLDFQETETEQRENQERSTADKESDSELQAYMDEPLTDEEWLKNYRQQQEEKNKQEEVLKKRLADETSGLQPSDRYQKESYACRFLSVYC